MCFYFKQPFDQHIHLPSSIIFPLLLRRTAVGSLPFIIYNIYTRIRVYKNGTANGISYTPKIRIFNRKCKKCVQNQKNRQFSIAFLSFLSYNKYVHHKKDRGIA